jgi:hypothetical protein
VVRSLNVYAILTFLFYFGVVGIVLHHYSQATTAGVFSVASAVGLVAAIACSAILHRLFGDASGLVTHENSGLRGHEVKVTHPIRDGGIGEVIFAPPGGVAQNIPARSMDGTSMPVGQRAVVVEVNRGVALVARLDSSMETDSQEDETEL